MSSVTYRHQPGIDATNGKVPISGTEYPYRVTKLLWPRQVEAYLETIFLGRTLHLCCGKSRLGDIRLDIDPLHSPSVLGDITRLPFASRSIETVLIDPPYNGRFQFNHDYLAEIARIGARRLIHQHWYLPANRKGTYRKSNAWKLNLDLTAIWNPASYFGRVQVISVFDLE